MKDFQHVLIVAIVAVVGLVAMGDINIGGGTVVMDENGELLAEGSDASNLVGDARALKSKGAFYIASQGKAYAVERTVALKALRSGVYVQITGLGQKTTDRVYSRYGFTVNADGVFRDGVQVADVHGDVTDAGMKVAQGYVMEMKLKDATGVPIPMSQQADFDPTGGTQGFDATETKNAQFDGSTQTAGIQATKNAQFDATTQNAAIDAQETKTAQFDGSTQTAGIQATRTAQFDATTQNAQIDAQEVKTAQFQAADTVTATLSGQSANAVFDASGNQVVCMSADGSAGVVLTGEKAAAALSAQNAVTAQQANTASDTQSWDCANPKTKHGDKACVYGRHAYGHGTGYWTATCMKGAWTINGGKCNAVVEETTHNTKYDCSGPEGMNGEYACIKEKRFVCKGNTWTDTGGSCAQ